MENLKVYCIMDEENHLYEICKTLSIALDHSENSCYKIANIKTKIIEKLVWEK